MGMIEEPAFASRWENITDFQVVESSVAFSIGDRVLEIAIEWSRVRNSRPLMECVFFVLSLIKQLKVTLPIQWNDAIS
jgi:hypothetical protein